ncbi:MAG: threonine--tRNA ligase, partial [Rickettsiaceae bacterium]|nr:threonine--tRNA ligase [Rickettsiaceae bacterium]
PEVRAGGDDIWDQSEKALRDAVTEAGYSYSLNPGEGAFYGPKLEFVLTDAIGRQWQCGTLQVDFVLPERLDASYIDQNGQKQRPVMLHRAIIGTFERFLGVFIENTAGNFPIWLAPIQVGIATVTTAVNDYAKTIKQKLDNVKIRSELDISNEKINYKIREMSHQKYPYIIIIGANEMENNNISVRKFGTNETILLSVAEFVDIIEKENARFFN